MESEETFDGFGFNPREEEFYTTTKNNISWELTVPDILGGYFVILAPEKLSNTRSIYSALDFLGDVGGLFDMLCIVAKLTL